MFGPVVTIQPFDTEEEAISLANGSKYGLNAMLFTENGRRAHRVAGLLRLAKIAVEHAESRDSA